MNKSSESKTLQIREALNSAGGPQQAEQQLALIGTSAGDSELARIVEELEPHEVAALVGQGDYTKPSLAAGFVTPKQLIASLERLGAKWGEIGNMDGYEVLRSLKEDLADFLLSIILSAQDSKKKELLATLLESAIGWNSMVAIAIGDKDTMEFLVEFDANMVQKGTWQELYVELQESDRKSFEQIRNEVLGLYAKVPAEQEATENDSSAPVRFLRRSLRELANRAAEHTQSQAPESVKPKEAFVDI